MQHVQLIDNPLDPATWEAIDVEDVRAFLIERYSEWPAGARIYHGTIGDDHDVTPATPGDVDRLAEFDQLTVVIFPEGPIFIIAAIAIAIIATIALIFLLPSIPKVNTQTGSANNSLSERGNQARPNGRIPDIFGQVRSIPDLIAAPYRVYEDHREVEIAYMCIGRGPYLIEDVRDGSTLISEISGASISVYSPNSSPNNFATPQLQIGSAISDPIFNAIRLNEVNGQDMIAPNSAAVKGDQEIKFKDGGIIEASGGAIDFTAYFTPGDVIDIGNGGDTGITDPASAIFAAATAVAPNKLRFSSFDPSGHFTVGQSLVVAEAVWTSTTAPAGGGISGGTGGGGSDNPDYPDRLFQRTFVGPEP